MNNLYITCVETFGVFEGTRFFIVNYFFGMTIYLWWCKLIKKKWCTYHGYSCKDKNCTYEKLDKPRELKFHDLVPGTICEYCGTEIATVQVNNPNWQEDKMNWDVCPVCKDVIKYQRQLSMGILINNLSLVNDAQENLSKISKESNKSIMSAMIYKTNSDNYDVTSIVYKGDNNG